MTTTTDGTTRTRGPTPARPGPAPRGPGRRRAPVDPRIRRRQIDVRRAEGRRRLRWVVAVLTVALVLAGAWGSTRSPLLDVDRVLVEGATHTPEDAVRSAAGVAPGQPMTDVDGSEAAARLSELAWVQRADVRREWPGTVRIRVAERIATVATRNDAGAWALVDRTGRVLAQATAPPPGMAVVEGVPVAGAPGTQMEAAATDALETAAQLPPGLASRVALVTTGPTGVELRLAPHGIVLLGTADDVVAKLRAVHAVLSTVEGRTVSVLDVRVPRTPVLTRQ